MLHTAVAKLYMLEIAKELKALEDELTNEGKMLLRNHARSLGRDILKMRDAISELESALPVKSEDL